MGDKRILLIGTYDTKDPEMRYIEECITAQGGKVLTMDVSVLGDPTTPTDISKDDVAAASGMTIEEVIAQGDENKAFRVMSSGAAAVVTKAYAEGRFDAMLATGGTMGTDLALDCAQTLPMGVPKYIVSTVSFSPLIPPHRLAPDVQMILWAGGLYGMNSVCRSSLSQAAGAVLGAARAVEAPGRDRPMIGMTSLGSSCLRYMKTLKPALEKRGFEVAVFHSTGMGGMAFEKLAGEGAFCCVMDFCMQEFANMLAGSLVSSGEDRLTNAGFSGIPQMVAPGALDLLDFAGWQEIPERFKDRPFHEHNRLIKSAVFNAEERRAAIAEMATRLKEAKGPVHFFLPTGGIEEWDREGREAHDPEALTATVEAARELWPAVAPTTVVDAHINDAAFVEAVLKQFDAWVDEGIVVRGDSTTAFVGSAK
ncbi:Tm-1-like ATP-binding domain-containing protein [uncultured Ruegeria sp.]|uniref:Tm-1-like ATP-binding domain-containing protein n=1 Tax=uncultured Ruegeria sp. TaxID=259304 RepID=UPI00261ADD4E|nr:Tm-1-like ATP-binding domain-containing protein [uncultured Ruegeria sp.]